MQKPWEITGQTLYTSKSTNELRLTIAAQRGTLFPCPVCGKLCHAHDFKEMTWRHLNFFQHHCYITASSPRIRCPEHKVKQVTAPGARKGKNFALLLEQAAMILVREIPVLTVANILKMNNKRPWRIVPYYVSAAMNSLASAT